MMSLAVIVFGIGHAPAPAAAPPPERAAFQRHGGDWTGSGAGSAWAFQLRFRQYRRHLGYIGGHAGQTLTDIMPGRRNCQVRAAVCCHSETRQATGGHGIRSRQAGRAPSSRSSGITVFAPQWRAARISRHEPRYHLCANRSKRLLKLSLAVELARFRHHRQRAAARRIYQPGLCRISGVRWTGRQAFARRCLGSGDTPGETYTELKTSVETGRKLAR